MSSNSHQAEREQSQLICQNGLRLLQQGNLEEADKLFLEAHLLDAENIDALNLLGIRSYQKSELQNALNFLNSANHIAPNSAQTLSNLGLVHNALFDFQSALECFDLAITSNPNIPETHNNRGIALKGLNRNQEAVNAYQHALALRPNYAEALSNQGVILLEEGNPKKAIPLFEQAIEANPNLATAYNNLGNALTQLDAYESAFQCFERALQINSRYLDACLNFGNSLKKAKQFSAAIDCYQHALKINPEHAKTFFLLGEIYYDSGDCDLAKTYYAKSLTLDPSNLLTQFALTIAQIPKVYKNEQEVLASRASFSNQLGHLQANSHQSCSFDEILNILKRHPFYLAYQDENNEPLLSQYGALCSKQALAIQDHFRNITQAPKSKGKIRIGIVSHFFCNHPVWHAITKGWVNHLNPDQFEINLFNTNGLEDAETDFAKSKTANYINCTNSIERAAQTIIAQNLDLLLYPEIAMDTTSKALACLRLAPVQAVSWGHPETTGLETIDFYLSGQMLEPNRGEDFYSEQLVRLPNLGTYFENEIVKPITPNLAALGIDPSLPILLCAGSPSKYNPNDDSVFIEIAKRVGQCQFIFFNFDENLTAILKERLQLAFSDAQLDAKAFLRFIPFLKKEEFHGLMQKADLYLDTIGFSGFNTAMQAITCDLPIVTIEGKRMRGRLASAILNQIGLENLVCQTNNGYIDLVVELLQNRDRLNAYRDQIAKSKAILFNDLEPIKALENFLIQQTRK
ncbi:glycosyltransferase family 41 protein [Polynucleobacter sp. JS-Polo-80-F4]|uniref:tetratricopeptide repeat protein n=1 Tax=Polynucleobacter sp. JS-Polo-80-F4 TaxID=2576918 RepID=UPI001C0E53F6|nr:glycosyltransferase family 41 protein [Polynucleobacter sp. JS-Polo-80-F4]MBU3616535.1 tetratricopeptide repeat protein [Polynucleobacter sp. JS-Polo-80-F4]